MNDEPVILMRWCQILCPWDTASALQALLDAIPTASPGLFNLVEPVGPEHEPGYGLASTITHALDGPYVADETFRAARAIVQAFPDALIRDTRWTVLDGGQTVQVWVEGAVDLLQSEGLFNYDETILG